MIFGETRSKIIFPVLARAAAVVVGGTLVVSSPPPARNPCPELTTLGLESHVAHQAGLPGRPQVMAGFCSVCSSGGNALIAKLLGITSYATPAPPRIDHLPLPVGSNAKPSRGAKLFLSGLGARKKMPSAGSSAMALSVCRLSPSGTPTYSYRNPALMVSREVSFQSSCANQYNAL